MGLAENQENKISQKYKVTYRSKNVTSIL